MITDDRNLSERLPEEETAGVAGGGFREKIHGPDESCSIVISECLLVVSLCYPNWRE